MTRGFRHASTILLGTALAAGLSLAPARAEELRLGFIAPMTGIFAQVGKDMVNGFQMYLDEHGDKLGGMDVKFIVEDDQAKPDLGVTKAKKLVSAGQGAHVHRRRAGLDRLRAGARVAPLKTIYIAVDSRRPTISRSARRRNIRTSIRTGWSSSQPHQPLGAMGLRSGLQEDRHDRRRLRVRLRVGRRLPEGVRGLRRQGDPEDLAAARHQGLRTLYPDDQGGRRRHLLADGRADGAQFPKQLRAAGYKKPIVGGGTSYDEFALPFMGDEVIGDVSALQY